MPWPGGKNPYRFVKAGRAPDLGDYFWRSSWERNVARYLKYLECTGAIQGWAYEPMKFTFPRGAGYIPDFRIDTVCGEQVWWEVKGRPNRASQAKANRMARYYPDVKLALLLADDYRRLERHYAALIPEWEGGHQELILE